MSAPAPRRGFALLAVMLVMLVAAALATGAVMMGSNHILADRHLDRAALLRDLADEGLELGRAVLNADAGVLPPSGWVELTPVIPTVGGGDEVAGMRRRVYAGSLPGGALGVVAVAENDTGDRAVRQASLHTQSLARFAYATVREPGGPAFAGGERIAGPVHTGDVLRVGPGGATFLGPVSAGRGIEEAGPATLLAGRGSGTTLHLPDLDDLRALALPARSSGLAFVGDGPGADAGPLRLEFVAVDLNGDGDTTDADEGFLRAYRGRDLSWTAATTRDPARSSNCGDLHDGTFVAASDHSPGVHDGVSAVAGATAVCALGGDPLLTGGTFEPASPGGRGRWLPAPGPVDRALAAAVGPVAARFLHPLHGPDFAGVVHVEGNVVVSGRVRGRVTLVATGSILVADDLVLSVDPGAATCLDALGLVAGEDVVILDNAVNAPRAPGAGIAPRTLDDTADEFLQAAVLALGSLRAENPAGGPAAAEPCEGDAAGRGCLYLAGGVVQGVRGALGHPTGTGYVRRLSYDACGSTAPPPHFPAAGRFSRGAVRDVDPDRFDIDAIFTRDGRR